MKIKIAILEDETLAAKDLKCKLSEWSTHRNFEIELSEYCSGEDFWIQNTDVDLNSYAAFFLDIQMNKISGLEVAQKLRKDGYLNHIINLFSRICFSWIRSSCYELSTETSQNRTAFSMP